MLYQLSYVGISGTVEETRPARERKPLLPPPGQTAGLYSEPSEVGFDAGQGARPACSEAWPITAGAIADGMEADPRCSLRMTG